MSNEREDISDAELLKEQQKNVKKEADLKRERLRTLMDLPQAQDEHWELIVESHVFATSFHNSGAVMAFNEGQRSIGLNMLARWIEASPSTFFSTMQRKKGLKNG